MSKLTIEELEDLLLEENAVLATSRYCDDIRRQIIPWVLAFRVWSIVISLAVIMIPDLEIMKYKIRKTHGKYAKALKMRQDTEVAPRHQLFDMTPKCPCEKYAKSRKMRQGTENASRHEKCAKPQNVRQDTENGPRHHKLVKNASEFEDLFIDAQLVLGAILVDSQCFGGLVHF
ncbi:unnamed protein product [Caenorhabditis brenneri]